MSKYAKYVDFRFVNPKPDNHLWLRLILNWGLLAVFVCLMWYMWTVYGHTPR